MMRRMRLGDMKAEKLSYDAFRAALAQGRGVALMHVLAHGLAGVDQLVLTACLENQAYDRQCEELRAPWLYRMFKNAPEYEAFRRRIMIELLDMSEDSSAEQLCDLAALMAYDGDDEAKAALRTYVWGQDFAVDTAGCHAIASVDGLAAVREIARRYGRVLLAEPDAFVDTLDGVIDDAQAQAGAFADLAHLAQSDTNIAAYVRHEQQDMDRCAAGAMEGPAERVARRQRSAVDILAGFPLDAVLAAATRHDPSKVKFLRFGRWCDDAALVVVLERLNMEHDPEAALRLLWVFQNATPPFIPACLWGFAVHPDARLRDAALTALGHVADPAVGAFARHFLGQRTFAAEDAAVIELFTNNFQPGDENLIMDALDGMVPDDDEAHRIGLSVLAFAKRDHLPSTAAILHWLYRTNPCTICRASAIGLLADAQCLDVAVRLECQFDANAAVRTVVTETMSDSPGAS